MRTKVVFSGSIALLLVVAAIGFIVSRDRKVSANVYYYCWECAEKAETGLGCVQVQYTTPDHLTTFECPQGTFANEGLCAISCVNPSTSSSASSVASSSDSSSSVASMGGEGASSQSSQLILVITGIEEPPIYLLTAAGIIQHPAFLLIAAAVTGLLTYAFVRKK